MLVAVFVAVVSLLLVAATNVAGLLIARATGRAREMSVHAALGAGRGRLVAQNFGEAAVLAVCAGASGLGAAWLAVTALDRVDRVTIPRFFPIAIDAQVAGFALLLTALVAILAGLLPSWQAFRNDLSTSLRISPLNAGGHTSRAGRVLIVLQTAMTLALLVGAGLVVRSLSKLDAVETGFRRDVFTAQIQLPALRYPDEQARLRFVNQWLERSANGQESAGIISELPLSGSSNSGSFDIDGRIIPQTEKQPHADMWSASPTYFGTLGIPLKKGRLFDDGDVRDRPAVAIVSETFAARYFPGEDPIGRRIDFEGNERNRRWREIVGVVGDVRDRRIELASDPQVYMPYAQRATSGLFLVVRGGDPERALSAMRAVVQDIDPALPIYSATTMAGLRDKDTRDRRIAGTALSGFAIGALVVAVPGLYGLIAQSVRQRVREIGVRVAVGASPRTGAPALPRRGRPADALGRHRRHRAGRPRDAHAAHRRLWCHDNRPLDLCRRRSLAVVRRPRDVGDSRLARRPHRSNGSAANLITRRALELTLAEPCSRRTAEFAHVKASDSRRKTKRPQSRGDSEGLAPETPKPRGLVDP